jgi:hypothetical protein
LLARGLVGDTVHERHMGHGWLLEVTGGILAEIGDPADIRGVAEIQ